VSERSYVVAPAAPGAASVSVSGRLSLPEAGRLRADVAGALASSGARTLDLSGVTEIDAGASAALIDAVSRAEAARGPGSAIAVSGATGDVAALVDLFLGRRAREDGKAPPSRIGVLDQIGRTTAFVAGEFKGIADFVGQSAAALVGAVRRPGSVNWADVGPIAERSGPDGLPIVATLCLLLGLILAFQAAIQLHQFGMDIYVADGVALSVTRELGPLMVAITVTGRSGAAFAAELGTMKVSEEVDALRTIGICPYRYLVLPRLFALVVVVPILTLLGDAVAILGGFLVGVFGLGIPAQGYLIQTHNALSLAHVFTGVGKSIAFAAAIALIGCERGLSTSGGATGVGRSTTSSVVTILFHLVMIDFMFTLLFDAYGI